MREALINGGEEEMDKQLTKSSSLLLQPEMTKDGVFRMLAHYTWKKKPTRIRFVTSSNSK